MVDLATDGADRLGAGPNVVRTGKLASIALQIVSVAAEGLTPVGAVGLGLSVMGLVDPLTAKQNEAEADFRNENLQELYHQYGVPGY
jgi:hypothetical protein